MTRILHPIMVAFAWIWLAIHSLLTFLGVPPGPGFGWILSIVLLTLLVRVLILPLYLKQMRSMRSMQVLQPELKKLQDKYKGKKDQLSRQKQSEEMMALYKEHGASPFASCLPMLVQLPIIFALYRVIFAVEQIKDGTYAYESLGPLTKSVATDIDGSTFFGVGLSQSFGTTSDIGQKIVFVIMIVIMVSLQFLTMRLSMKKNMASQMDSTNPMMKNQKVMMYMMPMMFVFTGFVFKMALLIYMVTTTVFSYLQQLWVIKVMPTPGSPAYQQLLDKRETAYKKWAVPAFNNFDAEKENIGKDETKLAELESSTLALAEKDAKKQKIASDFPEDWTVSAKLAVYRGLALEPWKEIPDELWMRQIVTRKKRAEQRRTATKPRPRKLSREQRMRLAERERQEEAAARRRAERDKKRRAEQTKKGADLTPEEIERRRQERRAQRREQRRKKSK